MDRRSLLNALGTTAYGAFLTSCAKGMAPSAVPSPPRGRIAPVDVSADRVIRTIVGLRPYRAAGFVVRTEVIDGKPVVHNYGHGGGGITLCWGSAPLAVEEALQLEHRQCAVLGCGVMGLTTAILLQRHGFQVTIYARDLPPLTTSNIAGGYWMLSSVYEDSAAPAAFKAQFVRAARFSHRYFQELVGPSYGVRWLQNYRTTHVPVTRPAWFPDLIDLFPELEELAPGQHPFPRRYVYRNRALQIQPPVFLPAIERDFRLAGGQVVVRECRSVRDVLALPEPLVINCTGLGARDLFGDTDLVPVKGQLTILLPQPEVDYFLNIDNAELYMHPRPDGILLGGTFERGVSTLQPDDTESRRILSGHAEFSSAMRRA